MRVYLLALRAFLVRVQQAARAAYIAARESWSGTLYVAGGDAPLVALPTGDAFRIEWDADGQEGPGMTHVASDFESNQVFRQLCARAETSRVSLFNRAGVRVGHYER